MTLLRHFILARSMAALGQDAGDFPACSRAELQRVARGLVAAGFLRRVRGKTRGAVYMVSQDGLTTLHALETLHAETLLRVTSDIYAGGTGKRDDSLRP